MRVLFEIKYRANYDEQLCINGDITLPLTCRDGELWQGEFSLPLEASSDGSYRYHYEVRRSGYVVRTEEASEGHLLRAIPDVEVCHIRDVWGGKSQNKPFNSSLFTDVLFRRESPMSTLIEPSSTVIECRCAVIEPSNVLAVVGVSKELGHWDASKALVLNDVEFPRWSVALPRVAVHTEFKFVVLDRKSGEVVAWEQGDNRMIEPYQFGVEAAVSVLSFDEPRFDLRPWRGIGVAIPIFSLRTERSMGVGDFGDIRNMVDWAVERGMSVIQILPINDTTMGGTWEDSYPYNANSTIALHPQYLALREVAEIKDEKLRASFERRAEEIDKLPQIDYTAVSALKVEYLRIAFAEQFNTLKGHSSYKRFFDENSWWLESYALFSALRDRYKSPDFSMWGDDSKYSSELLESYKDSETLGEMEFYYFIQYHLHTQLLAATNYARSRGVALKGDIPIGISRTSVDAWIYPELFNMSSQAGAPPDPFSDLGQNWGFPTYNWGRMAEDGFAWWRRRFEKMAEYFDAYRIDHILGFFRIWEIPLGSVHGLTGRFNPSLPLTRDEIERGGFPLAQRHLLPCVTDWTLSELLGDCDIEQIKSLYFDCEQGIYTFKKEFDTQRKIAATVTDEMVRDGLMLLHNEVLFIEDVDQPNHYHPRILGANSLAYKALAKWEQEAFDNLHNDFYYSRHNDFWRDSAMSKLPTLIGATNMLVCGEDLGMIPDCVEEVMQREQILSLEIERMPKAVGVDFATPSEYPYLSVCTCSTHDMTTIRGWWREDKVITQRYYNEALGYDGEAPAECSCEIARAIVERQLQSNSMLTILPWQDWMSYDAELRCEDVDSERINVPANSRHYWRYRMHLKI